jgi:colanic acid/amylovoran biosynthesis protein
MPRQSLVRPRALLHPNLPVRIADTVVHEASQSISRALPQDAPRLPSRASDGLSVLLLGASFDTGNHGVSALASGTISSLCQTLPDPEIRFLDYGREPVTHKARLRNSSVAVETVLLRFSKKPWQRNHIAWLLLLAVLMRVVPFSGFRAWLISRNPWLRRITGARLFPAISGGDSFSDIYGLTRLLYMSLPQILVLLLRKPLVLLPQTYGPFKTATARALARFILRRAQVIYSRDAQGIEVVTGLLGHNDARVKFAFDMGFALEPLPPNADIVLRLADLKRQGVLVGLNVSGLLYMGGYNRNNMFGLKADYAQLVRAIIGCLAEKDCQVLLVPHVLGDEQNSESDVPACRQIMAELGATYPGRLHFIDGKFDHHEIKYIIGQCDFFLGARMHACIAALSQCVPAVGMAYSRKFSGVLDSVGGGSRVVDLRLADRDQALAEIGEAFSNKENLRRELQEKMPRIKESVLNLFANDEFKKLLATQ